MVHLRVVPAFLCPSDSASGGGVFSLGDGAACVHNSPDANPGAVRLARSNYLGMYGTLSLGGHEGEEEHHEHEDDHEHEDEHEHDHGDPFRSDGVFFANSRMPLSHIPDGLSKTIAVGERDSRMGGSVWAGMHQGVCEAMARVVASGDHPPNGDPAERHFEDFSSRHGAGVNVVFCDGHVEFIADAIDASVYRSMCTRNGGD